MILRSRVMAKVKIFNEKARKNRIRVKRYRNFRRLKAIHEKRIHEQIYSDRMVFNEEIVPDLSVQGRDIYIVDKPLDTKEKLKRWAVNHHITRAATSDLLKILNSGGLTFLPRDSRTLLNTPTNIQITTLSNGKMWYNGIEKCLRTTFATIDRNFSVTLDFNFDGLPISNSSNMQFWPILFSIRGM